MTVTVRDEQLELLPERAFFWPARKILVFSDVHLGKAAALQSQGIPVPFAKSADLDTIAKLIRKLKPRSIYILGDWFHHHTGWTRKLETELADFFEYFEDLDWKLILGNHERGQLRQLLHMPFELIDDEFEVSPFIFTHGHLKSSSKLYQVQGHIHPVVCLREGSIKLRLPCFVVSSKRMTIPSFGELTGGFEITRGRTDRIYAVTDKTVFEVPKEKRPRQRPLEL